MNRHRVDRFILPLVCVTVLISFAISRRAGVTDTAMALDPDEARERQVEAMHIKASQLATLRKQIQELPLLTNWRMPVSYSGKLDRSPAKLATSSTHPSNVWYAIGPQPIDFPRSVVWNAEYSHDTGRISSIAATVDGPIYAGGEYGGVWEYSRKTKHWTPLTDNQVSLQVGAIALDPNHPETVYAGTGADSSTSPCGLGVFSQGLLKSTNGGKWELLGSEALAGAGIAKIAIEQEKNSPIVLATSAGIFRSTDGGVSWTRAYSVCATDVVVSPTSAHTLYAATPRGLVRSTDSGATWDSSGITQPALPAGFTIFHTLLAAARSRSHKDVLYASIEGNGCKTWAAYMSSDGGRTWNNIGTPKKMTGGFCRIGFAHALAVDPQDADIAVFGGNWQFLYNASSKTWAQYDIAAIGHSDTRALAFDAQAHLYVGTDGGLWEVPDPTNLHSGIGLNDGGLQVTEFNSGLSQSADGTMLMAGSQDNGTEIYQGSLSWSGQTGADGGATLIDQNDPTHWFAEPLFPVGLLEKTGHSNWRSRSFPAGFRAAGNLPIAISPAPPGLAAVPTSLYMGGNTLCKLSAKTPGGPMVWTTLNQACPKAGPNGCAANVSTIRVDPLRATHVFVVWRDGTVNFSFDSGNTWKIATVTPFRDTVTAIAASPKDPNTIAVATFSGRVWVGSEISSASPVWRDNTGNLPRTEGVSLNAVVYWENGLIVASDLGVFGQEGVGTPWGIIGRGLPNTRLTDLQWVSGDLVALTYGRGAWEISPQKPTRP